MKFYHRKWKQEKKEAIINLNVKYDPYSLFKGKTNLPEIVTGSIVEGSKLYDLNYLKDPFNFCISNRLNNLFSKENLTGWKSYEIQIGQEGSVYHGFQVTGKCGALIVPSSGWVQGFTFEPGSWDGSDFFSPPDRGLLFFTEKVANLINEHKITNFGYANIKDTRWYA